MSTIVAFTTPQVVKLTGLPPSTVRYWEQTGVFAASYIDDQPGRPFRRIYSFRDVVSLRALALLRRDYRIPLEELRRAGAFLAEHAEAPWASLTFGIAGSRLVFRDPVTGQWRDRQGQTVLEIPTAHIPDEIANATRGWANRDPHDIGRVERNRYVQHNAWVVAGTRIPTATIWAFHSEGYSTSAIQREFPRLSEIDIQRAIAHEQRLQPHSHATRRTA
jgi:DNA-binding transcriptional MerR regulator